MCILLKKDLTQVAQIHIFPDWSVFEGLHQEVIKNINSVVIYLVLQVVIKV